MKIKPLYFLLFLALAFSSCKKTPEFRLAQDLGPTSVDTTYTSDRDKNLTLVYFIPADLDTLAGWHKRLSDIFIYGQGYFGNNMQARGYGYKTYGLLKDDSLNLVKIIVIKGNLPKESYPYQGGVGNVVLEVNAYKTAHPNEFTSQHMLVIMPAHKYSADGNPGGVPFYGYGKWAFLLDYPDLNINYMGVNTPQARRAVGWIAANFHKMAHALNVPHGSGKVSDITNPALGYSLMGNGMRKFIDNQSFLTEADCAILNVNEVFQANNSISYYQPVTASIRRIAAKYNSASGNIEVGGRFQSSVNVANVIYYLDPNVGNEGTGTNNDYNAVTWRSEVIGQDSFKVSLPINELFSKGNYSYELKVKLVHQNGAVSSSIYYFDFVNDVPNINLRYEYEKTGWSIIAQSSQEGSYPASNIIDGKINTYWRSKYSSGTPAVLPHSFRGDMVAARSIKGVSFLQREDGQKPVKNFEIQFSNSASTGFVSAGAFVAADKPGYQYFDLSVPVTARYFRLVVTSNWDGTNDSAIGEFGLY